MTTERDPIEATVAKAWHGQAVRANADDHSASRRVDVLQREAPHLLAQPDEPRPSSLRIVVTCETEDGAPELLGTYTRTEEDAVFYVRPGGRENYAPADCCEIVTVIL